MKKLNYFVFAFLFGALFNSCSSNELDSSNQKDETKDELILEELKVFANYSINGALALYDKSNNYIDIEKLDDYIYDFNFSNLTNSRSTIENTSVNYEEYITEYLTEEAYTLLSSYISQSENINLETLEKLKADFSVLSEKDRDFFYQVYTYTYVIYEELENITEENSRAVDSGLNCALAATLAGSAASWVWATAFGGPVGVAVGIAWELATAAAAYYKC